VIRVLMPLVITEEQLEKGFEILDGCFREVQG
jgi:4-aminobutyrate aminotransferase-like enzyme